MKPFFQLIVIKNWRTYASLMVLFLLFGGGMNIIVAEQNRLLELPIAVQDLDNSQLSKQFVAELKKQPRFHVQELVVSERYPEDEVAKQRAAAVVVIPKDYAKRLTERRTSGLLTLYVQHNIVGDIVTESISKAAYKQQLPFIVATHLKDKEVSLDDVLAQYKKVEPAGQLTMRSLTAASPQSLGLAAIVVVMLVLGVTQIGLNRALCQPAALARILVYEANYRKFYAVYILAHSVVLVSGALCVMLLTGLALSGVALLTLFVAAILFEIGVVLLLIHVRTWSHQLFMALIWALTLAVVIVVLQLGGVG